VKSGRISGLSYDLKFDEPKTESDKMLYEICAVKKFGFGTLRILWWNNKRKICFNNQCNKNVVVETSLFNLKD
jgi:hypothetical protein